MLLQMTLHKVQTTLPLHHFLTGFPGAIPDAPGAAPPPAHLGSSLIPSAVFIASSVKRFIGDLPL